ncbi:M24 family metallopeptidase [Desulfoplanes sp.]
MKNPYGERLRKVCTSLQRRNLEALLVTHAANRYYLSGFELHDPQCNESAGCILVTADQEAWLMTDARYKDTAARIWPAERIFIYSGNKNEEICAFIRDRAIRKPGIEAGSMSVSQYKALGAGLDPVPTKNIVEEVRVIKDRTEIKTLKKSCALNHRVFAELGAVIAPGMSEAELAWAIEKKFRDNGASELSFATIVAAGPNGALPHAIPDTTRISENSPLLIDMGGRVDGYCSDQTRTFWVGDNPSTAFGETLNYVQEAQRIAIEHYLPGRPVKEADQAARGFFKKHGLENYFTHSLGHGVGLETHESPGIGPRSTAIFAPGMVVTAEPGLYYPKWGGVRWEHMVLITEDGHEVL